MHARRKTHRMLIAGCLLAAAALALPGWLNLAAAPEDETGPAATPAHGPAHPAGHAAHGPHAPVINLPVVDLLRSAYP